MYEVALSWERYVTGVARTVGTAFSQKPPLSVYCLQGDLALANGPYKSSRRARGGSEGRERG